LKVMQLFRSSRRLVRAGALGATLSFAAAGWAAPAQQAPVQRAPVQQLPAQPAPAVRKPALDERVARLERLLESQSLVEMLTQLEQLQNELRSLRGEIEEQTHALDDIKRRQRELYLDVDRRLRKLELSSVAAAPTQPSATGVMAQPGTTGETAQPAVGGQTVQPRATGQAAQPAPSATARPGATQVAPSATAASAQSAARDPRLEQAAYQHAFGILKEGRYEQAVEVFREFLNKYPDSSYADNSQYWLGEAHYVTRNFQQGLTEFRKVIDLYPDSPKVPDAMLKIGFIRYELGEWTQARAILQDVTARFPKTTSARLAENRLQRMKLEGH